MNAPLKHLKIRAGKSALSHIQQQGLKQEDIKVLLGASGGPKWFVLHHLDRYLLQEFFSGRKEELHLFGSSIGSWRFACYARKDPTEALLQFKELYMNLPIKQKDTPRNVTRESWKVMDELLGESGIQEILHNPVFKLSCSAVGCRGFAASENKWLQAASLVGAALANKVDRSNLRYFLNRTIFTANIKTTPFKNLKDFPTELVPFSPDNLKPAVLASGSVPIGMEGIRNIPGTSCPVYRDGGVIDYHFDFPFYPEEKGLVLYPHFMDRVIPGWFDKNASRTPSLQNYSNVLLLTPKDSFVQNLPKGRIGDRKDFDAFPKEERVRFWKGIEENGKYLAEDFHKFLQNPAQYTEELNF